MKKKGDTSSKIPSGVDQLVNALESGAYMDTLLTSPAIEVTDSYLPLNHLFTAATKQAFKKEVKTLIVKRRNPYALSDLVDKVAFFSCTAIGERNIFDAAKKVANTVNGYSAQGLVTGCLVKLSIVRLHSEEWELEKYVVFSYPCMTEAGYELAQNEGAKFADSCWTVEGGIGKAVVK